MRYVLLFVSMSLICPGNNLSGADKEDTPTLEKIIHVYEEYGDELSAVSWGRDSQIWSDVKAVELARAANARDLKFEQRLQAIGCLLATYVSPDNSSKNFQKQIVDGRWIRECEITLLPTALNQFPLPLESGDRVVVIDLLHELNKGYERWKILLVVRKSEGGVVTKEEIVGMFDGSSRHRSSLRIKSFALTYPFPTFSKEGNKGGRAKITERYILDGLVGLTVSHF